MGASGGHVHRGAVRLPRNRLAKVPGKPRGGGKRTAAGAGAGSLERATLLRRQRPGVRTSFHGSPPTSPRRSPGRAPAAAAPSAASPKGSARGGGNFSARGTKEEAAAAATTGSSPSAASRRASKEVLSFAASRRASKETRSKR